MKTPQTLNQILSPVQRRVLRRGSRVFALLGKPTVGGVAPFGREDLGRTWALTCEFGCLRLEDLNGAEEVTGLELFLPTPFSYEYGVGAPDENPELTRAVFGLLPSELDQIVTVLRRGSFPVLGYSTHEAKCSLTSSVIPAGWPHVVVSNVALYGNVVSLESFVRVLVSSLPKGHLAIRFPGLQPVLKQMMLLMLAHRPGLPYHKELFANAPADLLAAR